MYNNNVFAVIQLAKSLVLCVCLTTVKFDRKSLINIHLVSTVEIVGGRSDKSVMC